MVSDKQMKSLSDYMEDGLNPYSTGRWFLINPVVYENTNGYRLNPYSTGRWFLIPRKSLQLLKLPKVGLNPYSTGRWFLILTN